MVESDKYYFRGDKQSATAYQRVLFCFSGRGGLPEALAFQLGLVGSGVEGQVFQALVTT